MMALRAPTTRIVHRLRSERFRLVAAMLAPALAVALFASLAGAAPASAQTSWWRIGTEAAPTNLPPEGEGQIVVVVSNLGDETVNGANSPLIITDLLPAGVSALSVNPAVKNGVPVQCTLTTPLRCTFAGVVNPYERLAITINVKITDPRGTVATLPEQIGVEGADATPPPAFST